MPTSVAKLFSDISLSIAGNVRWGLPVKDDYPGVYVVATTSDPYDEKNIYSNNPPIDLDNLQNWINYVSTVKVNNVSATPDSLKEHLARFWLPDEPILYIGKAGTSLKIRIQQYYTTKLGNNGPHAGGYWLKTLSILDSLSVFWAASPNPEDSEKALIRRFIEEVSPNTLSSLLDPSHPFPFANLEYPQGTRKNHGINGKLPRNK